MTPKEWKNPSLTNSQHVSFLSVGAASPEYWLTVAMRQAYRIRALQVQFVAHYEGARTGDPSLVEFFHEHIVHRIPSLIGADGHLMIYAADHVVTICERHLSLTQDPGVNRAVSKFKRAGVGCDRLRDMFAHIEDYFLGTGRNSLGAQIVGPDIDFFSGPDLLGEVTITFGAESIQIYSLKAALSTLVKEVRAAITAGGYSVDGSS